MKWMIFVCAFMIGWLACEFAAAQPVQFQSQDSSIQIALDNGSKLTYIFNDEKIQRPYFAHIQVPGGIQITRNHPPVAGQDKDDHADMHPGLWMSFGDISGHDYWRNKALTKHVEFIQQPQVKDGKGHFAVREHHLKPGSNEVVCTAEHSYTFEPVQNGTLMIWDAEFDAQDGEAVFGDQEEMGLGVRVASSVTVENGGEILNAEGMKNGKEVWGKQSNWCVYHKTIEGKPVGVMVMPSPNNFRKSWFHARDYGLLVANPFGRNAFTKEERSRVLVKKGEPLRLQFGIVFFHGELDYADVYHAYLSNYVK